jgi:phosphoribosylformimino-5-aminoimidazole carboxamide ribotide isomerase
MATTTTFDVLPAIDLRGGHVVRLEEGDFERETVFADDPVGVATDLADDGAEWIHVVDLDAARTGVPTHGPAIAAVVGAVGGRLRVEVAGGLRTESAVASALERGAARVVVGTAAIRDPAFAGRLIRTHGSARIAVAIDVRDDRAVGDAWTVTDAGVDAAEAIRRLADAGVETFEVTAIERDGRLVGPNLPLYERLVGLGHGAIIASGGVASRDDILAIKAIGCRGAIIGRAIYTGGLSVSDALEAGGR